MNMTGRKTGSKRFHVLKGLKEGFRYAFGFPPIRSLLFLLALVSLTGVPYTVLMPVFAKNILHGGPQTLGFLMGASGVGAVVGALYLASRRSVLGLGKIIVVALNIFGFGLIAFSLSRVLILSIFLMIFVGFGMMVQMASSNTIIQTIVEEDKRGRVMSFYTMAFMGTVPFGSLFAGSLASKIGAPETVILSGVGCIVGAILFAKKLPSIRQVVRPIYVEKGILPEQPE
jgi:MFS family permease